MLTARGDSGQNIWRHRNKQGFLNGAFLTQGIKAAVEMEKLSAQQKKQLTKRHPSSPSYRRLKARIFQRFKKQTRNQTAQLTNSPQKRKYKYLLNMKRGKKSTSLASREMYIRTAMSLPRLRMAIIKKANNMLAKGQRGPSITAGRNVNL